MTDIAGLMQQAKKMQEQMQKAQEELALLECTGESGAGLVKVTINGRHEVKNVELDPALLNEDKEIIEDLVAAAMNDAVKKVAENNKSQLSGMTAGLNLPEGFKLPF
ncbi:MAG: YbaB/EbfC family nucleoid-associated protein [SAR86 cluster bacterium]|uniref:Nucleoid-associated protein COA71_12250 n=1 Tax=SAR86 cluster bacterium TaxID=2030880 RepID=A0A2A5C810_9GAMM|nr:MAG: YbaB/EbfC family nucleoid-associated protein [SAR86 cluster bacterium]